MRGEHREFLKAAAALGWEFDGYDGNNHLRLHHAATGNRYHTASSPSDVNSRRNCLADLKRIGQQAPAEPTAEIQLFTFSDDDSGHDVRVVVDAPNGEPVWIARDVCDVIGISKYRDAITQIDTDERVSVTVDTLGGPQQMAAVTEAGVWSLLLISRSPKVKPFKRWLTHHVLPEIRRTGSYESPQAALPMPSYADALRGWAEELEARQLAETERDTALEWAAELEAPANAYNELVAIKSDLKIRDAAKILCRDPKISIGQNRLFNFMKSIAWCFRNRDNSRWCAYQTAVDRGLLVEKPGDKYWDIRAGEYRLGEPVVLVTPKGLQELHKQLGGSGQQELELLS